MIRCMPLMRAERQKKGAPNGPLAPKPADPQTTTPDSGRFPLNPLERAFENVDVVKTLISLSEGAGLTHHSPRTPTRVRTPCSRDAMMASEKTV